MKYWDDGTIEEVLLSVIRHALWQTPLPTGTLGAKRFSGLMGNADKQSVTGLVAASLMEPSSGVMLPKRVAAKLMFRVAKIQEDNRDVAKSLQALCELMGGKSPLLVVKGQVVGALYPNPALRASGDIDFYVAPENWDTAMRLVKDQWKAKVDEDDDGGQHVSFDHGETLFEMHYKLYKFYSADNDHVFSSILAYNTAHPTMVRVPGTDSDVPTLCQPDNILYTFLHLYHHLVELGCGLRQFCDMAMLLNSFDASAENVARLEKNLRALDFMRAFCAVGAVLTEYLGLPVEKFPFPITDSDRKFTHDILSIVFHGGNFGFYGIEEPLRGNKKYYVKTFFRKIRRYHTFYRLAPKETRALFTHELPHKVWQTLTGKI